ncbi:MAG: DUF481 domain-containing protein [Ignavibacteriota bacterium]|jgi:hypothetical protein|nr:DUF481 domain-containing protein [Ignavibacteriales bacterium]MBL1123823.1 DUF481 domain-containing protein [Ignavibacteriota bacterium]MCC7092618.1 DUF481 domain-containing protein [Ignavibacteriaceae bacterium]MCE7855029.1 DUF481 domain-containing protein [Ignavibacteria bacterium CHB3]MEB2295207.1 DUF481 domain-containing protein [Ignavibacteria bacterium]
MSLLSNKNSNLSLSLLIFLLFSIQLFAQKTDIVTLLNGDKITGEVKYLRVGILTFKTDNMETVSIQWNKIQSIETQNYFEIEVADGRVFFGSIAPSDNEGMMIVKGVTLDHNLFMKYIVRINRIKESFWDILDGYVKFGFSFTKASQIGQISFGGNAKYRTKINVSELSLNSVITTTEKEATSSKNDLSFSYQHNLEHEWFAGGIASLQENSELGIKLRTSLGGGIGNNFIQSQNQWLYTLAGLSVNREVKTDNTEAKFNVEGLINVQYQLFKYDHPKANFLTYIYVFPSLNDFGRYRFNYNAQLSWEIFIDFYWDLTFYFEYDNEPQSENSSQSDYRIDTSIKFEF